MTHAVPRTPAASVPPADHARRGRRAPRLWLLAAVAAAYYLGARLGLGLALVQHNVTPLWPPTGVAVVAFLLFGRRLWPAVAVAALAVNLPILDSPFAAVATAVGNTLAPLLAVTLLRRAGFRRRLDRLSDALALVFLGALASMIVSAAVGTASLWVSGAITTGEVPTALAVWWTGDAMGVLVVAPFLLSLPLHRELPPWPPARWFEAVAACAVTTVVILWASQSHLHVLFLTMPVLAVAAWRLQLRGVAPAALAASLVMTWAAANERGPFAGLSLVEQMFTLGAYNAVVALTSFFLAALVSDRNRATDALESAAAELERRVEKRTAALSAANARLAQEIHETSQTRELLSHEEARARREHHIAETLQRTLLPELPALTGAETAARYVPASADLEVGGDWYDVLQLPGGLVGLAIGDVAGHGLAAASAMAQMRMALRAFAFEDPTPGRVLERLHRLAEHDDAPELVTVLYLVHDPATGVLRWSNAGHPPALLLCSGDAHLLTGALAPPVGAALEPTYPEATLRLLPGATLLLYTDGLVERRGEPVTTGLERLRAAAADAAGLELDALCDQLLDVFLERGNVADDVAVVGLRITAVGP